MRSRTAFATLAVCLVVPLAIAGCGGDDDDNGTTSAGTETTSTQAGGGSGVVSVADNPDLGKILVDANGVTLYLFEKDEGGESACYGGCAAEWPPYTTSGQPQAQGGALAPKLGTTKRDDGSTQVTYAGFPLYTYIGDSGPGDTNGNDLEAFGAEWYALQPSGEKPEDHGGGGNGSEDSGGSDSSGSGGSIY